MWIFTPAYLCRLHILYTSKTSHISLDLFPCLLFRLLFCYNNHNSRTRTDYYSRGGDTMFSDIVAIIAMFGTFFVVYLNYKKDMAMFKLDIRMERLNKLYVPFYRIYCTKMLLTRKLTDLSIEEIKEIFDILNNNLHYLETITQDCYCNVYRVYATWIDSSSSSVESENQLNYSFGLLSNLILLDYRKLLRKCRLPEPLPQLTSRKPLQK